MIKMKMLIACLLFTLTTASFNVLAGVDVVYVGNKGDCNPYVNDSNLVLAPAEVKPWLKNNATFLFRITGGGLHFCSRSAKKTFTELYSGSDTRLFDYLLEVSVDIFEWDITPARNSKTTSESKFRGEVFNLQQTLSGVFAQCPSSMKFITCIKLHRDTIINSQQSVSSQQYIATIIEKLAVDDFSLKLYALLSRNSFSKHEPSVRDLFDEQFIVALKLKKFPVWDYLSIELMRSNWDFYFERFKVNVNFASRQHQSDYASNLLRDSKYFFYIWDEFDKNKKQALYEYFSTRYSKGTDNIDGADFEASSMIKEFKDYFEFMLLSDSNDITEEVLRDFIDRIRGHFGYKYPYTEFGSVTGSLLSNAIIRYGIKNRLYWSESFIEFYVGEIMNGRFTYLKYEFDSAIKYSLPILFFYSDIEGSQSMLERKVKETIAHMKKTNCSGINLYVSGTKEKPINISCASYLSDINL